MPKITRIERDRINTPENLRLIAADAARLAAAADAKDASRRPAQPEGAR